MLDFTSKKPASPLRQTLVTGGAIAIALTFALIAVESYGQDVKTEVETTTKMNEQAKDKLKSKDKGHDITEDTMSEMETEMTDLKTDDPEMETDLEIETEAATDIMIDCPDGTEAQSDGTCRVVEGEWDVPEDDPEG